MRGYCLMGMLVVGMSDVCLSASVVKPAVVKPAATKSKSTSKTDAVNLPMAGVPTNPLEAVIRRMRSAGKRIGRQQLGRKTRDLQQQAIHDLQALIDQARNGQSQPNRSPSSAVRLRPSAGRNPPHADAQSADSGGKSRTGKPRTGKSRRSTDRKQTTLTRNRRIAERRMLVKELWGHLPPALRQRLLNIEGATPLPQYEQLIRRYFESLAEQDTHNPQP